MHSSITIGSCSGSKHPDATSELHLHCECYGDALGDDIRHMGDRKRHLLKINTEETTTLILNPEKTKLHRQVGYRRLGGRNVVG